MKSKKIRSDSDLQRARDREQLRHICEGVEPQEIVLSPSLVAMLTRLDEKLMTLKRKRNGRKRIRLLTKISL